MITKLELNKLLSSALDACSKAEGDQAEEGRAVGALRLLAQQQVSTELLAETEAGKRLKKVCKHTCKRIAEAAVAAVDAWKECVRKEQASKSAGTKPISQATSEANPRESSQPASQSVQSDGELVRSKSLPTSSQNDASSQPPSRSASMPKLNLNPKKSGDETRDKIRKLLAEALYIAISEGTDGDPCAVAVETEEALFVQNGGVNAKYKAKFRSLSFNLKDPKNPDLRGKVLSGEIPGDVLVNLSAEEMASSDMRAKNDQIREHMKNEAVRGQNQQASTDMFQCGRCKQRKCTYYQLQTRSADEPMTTFVTCTNCGNRWKFC